MRELKILGFVLVLLSFFFVVSAQAASISVVQTSTAQNWSGTTLTNTFTKNVAANDLIMGVAWDTGTGTFTNITSSCATITFTTSSLNYPIAAFYGVITANGACSVTATFSTGSSKKLLMQEVSGLAAVNPLDVQTVASTIWNKTATPAVSTATTANGDYVFAWIFNNNGATISSPGAGFTLDIGGNFGTEDQVQPSSGGVTAAWTMSTKSASYDLGVMAFRPAAAPVNPIINAFSAGTSTLSWNVANAASVAITPGSFSTSTLIGSIAVNPTSTTTYTLTATAASGATSTATIVMIPQPPTVATGAASSIATSSAILNGNITDAGQAPPSIRGFAYGLTTAYGATTTESGSFGTGAFSTTVTNLVPGATYHFMAYATNAIGTSYGNDQTFMTLNPQASGTTSSARIKVDYYEDMEVGNIGDVITPTILNAGGHGTGGTWSSVDGSSSMTVAASTSSIPVPVSVNGGGTYAEQTTRDWQFNHDLSGTGYEQFTFDSPLSKFSIGSFMSFGPSQLYIYQPNFDIISFYNYPLFFTINYTTVGAFAVRTETSVNHVAQWGQNIPVTPGKTYWVTVQYFASSSSSYGALYVYDPTDWTLVGSSTSPMDNIPATNVSFGVEGGNAIGPWVTSWGNILMDWTNDQFPLVPDPVPPTVTSFVLPPSSTSTTVNVATLTAADNVGVTDYLITESSSVPSATDPGWTANAPSTFTFTGAGTRTACAWAKDAIENISSPSCQTVAITLSDTVPPSAPTNLMVTGVTTSTISFSWAASIDNVGVAGYQIFRNGTKIATAATTSYEDANLVPGTTYTYTVTAFDAAGNISAQSQPLNVTTANAPSLPPAFVQSSTVQSWSGTTLTAAFPSSVTAGDLVVGVEIGTNPGSVTGMTSNCITGGLPYMTSTILSSYYVATFYGVVSTSGLCRVTATLGASGQGMILMHEVSGLTATNPLDAQVVSGTGWGTTSTPSVSFATTVGDDYIFGFEYNVNGATVLSPGTGFTLRAGTVNGATEDEIQPSVGSTVAQWNMSTANATYGVGIMAFKAK